MTDSYHLAITANTKHCGGAVKKKTYFTEHFSPMSDIGLMCLFATIDTYTQLTKKTEINHTNGVGYNGKTNRRDTERKLHYLSMFDKPRGLL